MANVWRRVAGSPIRTSDHVVVRAVAMGHSATLCGCAGTFWAAVSRLPLRHSVFSLELPERRRIREESSNTTKRTIPSAVSPLFSSAYNRHSQSEVLFWLSLHLFARVKFHAILARPIRDQRVRHSLCCPIPKSA